MDVGTTYHWIVFLPPVLVIATVLLTRKMILSFLVGIITAALIAEKGNPQAAAQLAINKLLANTGLMQATSIEGFLSSWNLLIFIFLICLGILIVLLNESGAAQAYIQLVSKKVHTKKEAESASLILSLFFFIDDYFSALTVGSVMKPLAQVHHVHPVKLAFLTTAMAAPLTLLSPISSWVGQIILQLTQIGVGAEGPHTLITADPYILFLSAIPYLLYPILLFIGTWYIVIRGISYGPMQQYDAYTGPAHSVDSAKKQPTSILDFLLPIASLIITVLLVMLGTGGFSWLGGNSSFIEALKNASVPQALCAGGVVSLVISSVYFMALGKLTTAGLAHCMSAGTKVMFPSLLMLVCAWSLGSLLNHELQTGAYIAQKFSSLIRVEFFPLMCFIGSALISSMIGSAWATIGLMFPLAIDMLQAVLHIAPNTPLASLALVIPFVGAVLSGAVFGLHISVISDNPILSAASTGANHIEHVKTMIWYVVPIGLSAALGFTCLGLTLGSLGLTLSWLFSLLVSSVSALVLLELGQFLFHKPSQ